MMNKIKIKVMYDMYMEAGYMYRILGTTKSSLIVSTFLSITEATASCILWLPTASCGYCKLHVNYTGFSTCLKRSTKATTSRWHINTGSCHFLKLKPSRIDVFSRIHRGRCNHSDLARPPRT